MRGAAGPARDRDRDDAVVVGGRGASSAPGTSRPRRALIGAMGLRDRRVVALVAGLVAACDPSRAPCEGPADLCEYHGEPSTMFCGQRWSTDHLSIACRRSRITIDALRPFTRLQSLHLVDVSLRTGKEAPSPVVQRLYLLRVDLADVDLPASFPGVLELEVGSTALDYRALARMRGLRYLSFFDTTLPDLADVLAVPQLESVMFVRMRCGWPDCARALGQRLLRERPSLNVQVDATVLSPPSPPPSPSPPTLPSPAASPASRAPVAP